MTMATMATISFVAPHWELVFRGKLASGRYGVKTRGNDCYRHRGPVLCHTGMKNHPGPMKAYGYKPTDIPRGIVGVAYLTDIRELTDVEKRALFIGYNKLADNDVAVRSAFTNDRDAIHPMDYGYFLKPVVQFKRPFVPPEQHLFGPVGQVPLYKEIRSQLPDWALESVAA